MCNTNEISLLILSRIYRPRIENIYFISYIRKKLMNSKKLTTCSGVQPEVSAESTLAPFLMRANAIRLFPVNAAL